MRLIDSILEIIFRRNIKMAADLNCFYKFRNFSDGITKFECVCDCDFYEADHNPKFTFRVALFNYYLIYFEVYNVYHWDSSC